MNENQNSNTNQEMQQQNSGHITPQNKEPEQQTFELPRILATRKLIFFELLGYLKKHNRINQYEVYLYFLVNLGSDSATIKEMIGLLGENGYIDMEGDVVIWQNKSEEA